MDPLVVLYVRTNVAWWKMDATRYFTQDPQRDGVRVLSAKQRPKLFRAVRVWNRTFRMPYWEYRHRLLEIAAKNWARLGGVDLIVKGGRAFDILNRLDRFLVVPVDDDDWFHPKMAEILRERYDPAWHAFRWTDAYYQTAPRGRQAGGPQLVPRRQTADFPTNGYAITAAGWRACPESARHRVIFFHVAAGKVFQKAPYRCCVLEHVLSATGKSLASSVNLQEVENAAELRRLAAQSIARTVTVPPDLNWTAEPIRMLDELNQQLWDSRRSAD